MQTIVSARVDLDVSSQTGVFTLNAPVYAVTNDDNRLDSTTQNVTINPPIVQASLEVQTAGREVTILANVTGAPAEGYEQRTTTTAPRTVLLDGPADVLENLTYVETEPVDVTGATQTTSVQVGIANLPEGVTILRPSDGQVNVIVQIQQQGINQTLPSLPVDVDGAGDGLIVDVSPAEVSIEISATATQLPALVNGAITISVDVSGLGPGTYSLTPSVVVPAGVEWNAINPAMVNVTITAVDEAPATPGATPGP
jgi:YbbR domain-containing protein